MISNSWHESRQEYIDNFVRETMVSVSDDARFDCRSHLTAEGSNREIDFEQYNYFAQFSAIIPGFVKFIVRMESEEMLRLCWRNGDGFVSRLLTRDETVEFKRLFGQYDQATS